MLLQAGRNRRITSVYVVVAITMVAILSLSGHVYAAESLSTWAKSYGGPADENVFRAVARSAGGGYAIAGQANSFGAGSTDVWVVKLGEDGAVKWQKSYGGLHGEAPRAIQATTDDGYVVAAKTGSFGAGSTDFWVVKLDSLGKVQWQKTYGGPKSELPHAIQQTSDEGYVVAGFTKSFGSIDKDYFVVKLDKDGLTQWQKRFGGAGEDVVRFVKEVSDGGYLVAGFTHSFGVGGEILILKLDSGGNLEWQKTYGGARFEEPSTILEVTGGYIAMEQSSSFTGSTDAWIFKIDKSGDILWQKNLGEPGGMDELSSAQLLADEGFVAAGETRSNGIPSEDFWVVRFDSAGNVQWQKRYGGGAIDSAESMELTREGGAIVVGSTRSFGAGIHDILVVRVDSSGSLLGGCGDGFETHDTAASVITTKTLPVDVKVTEAATTVTIKNTNATVKDSNAIVKTQCSVTPFS